jgi:hypothetical protein
MVFFATPDAAPAPVYAPVTVAAASASQAQTYGVCQFVPNPTVGGIELEPATYLTKLLPKDFLDRLYLNDLSQEQWDWYGNWLDTLSVKVLNAPQHGKMVGYRLESYSPNDGFTGKDSLDLLVQGKDMNGRPISLKLVYFVNVVSKNDYVKVADNYSKSLSKYCGTTKPYWRISDSADGATFLSKWLASNTLSANTSAPSTGSGQASTLLNSGITLNIADLPGGAVGETTGTSITLDTNAAGYGWYVDPNPAANTDFLPTSNPDVWMAKAGSAAAGKMDMLSVLLHEYGHALGLDHSVNPNDFMAPDLQPGERRLPSSAELAQLSQLATQLASTNNPAAPDNPTSPALPVGTALSALLIGRLRRTGYGSWTPVIDSIQIPAPQFERAVTLCNLSVRLK